MDDEYRLSDDRIIHIACTGDHRHAAWQLVYEAYRAQGYTGETDGKLWYGLHDALSDACTILIEDRGDPVGTVSIYPQSPMGFPAHKLYARELNAFCASGRRPVEIGSLAVTGSKEKDRTIVTNLFDLLSLYSRCLVGATDLVITVNPKHQGFYERMLLFEQIGGEKHYDRVGDAPAVLMRLDLEKQEQVIRWEHNEGPRPEWHTGKHTMYRGFSSLEEEERRVAWLKRACRPLDFEAFWAYFVEERPLVQEAPHDVQNHLESVYVPTVSVPLV